MSLLRRKPKKLYTQADLDRAMQMGFVHPRITQVRFHRRFPNQVLVKRAGESGWVRFQSLDELANDIAKRAAETVRNVNS